MKEEESEAEMVQSEVQTAEGLITLTNLALLSLQALHHEINNQNDQSIFPRMFAMNGTQENIK